MARPKMNEAQKAAMRAEREKAAALEKENTVPETAEVSHTQEVDRMVNEAAEQTALEKESVATNTAAVSYTQEEVDRMIKEAAEKAAAQAAAVTPQIIQVSANTPMVRMRFQAAISPDNQTLLGDGGKYGTMTGTSWSASIPHDAFVGDFQTASIREMLDKRMLIVVDGLTDEERELYGVKYYDGEILEETAFRKLVEMGDAILEVYPALCDGHKEAVAVRFITEYESNKQCISRETAVALNRMSKEREGSGKGDFFPIIEQMNAKDEE